MNEKANVTKELNAKHRKVLESLLKLPENRECADCKTKGPRWASVNLGIFICMQCSGIHRSLGTHISKVRSATLDTWLPEQVAFIQSMGNEKSNSHWETELPPNYDRVGIENFIRAKYEDKRWVSRDGKPKSPPERSEEKASMQWPRSAERVGHGYAGSSERLSNERKNTQPTATRSNFPAARVAVPAPPRGPEPVTPVPKPQSIQKVEPVEQQPEPANPVVQTTPVATPPKVDYATDLFNMLSLDGPSENGSAAASNDDNSWAGFQSAQEAPPAEKTTPQKPAENNGKSSSELEDLFKDSPSITPVPEKPQKDVKNDIMSLFEKTNIVSPYSLHQQQIAMLAQQQSLLMAAAARAAGADPKNPINTQQAVQNGTALPGQNWPNMAYQIPGMMMMPTAGNQGQARSTGPSQVVAPNVQYPASSFYGLSQATPVNGVGPAAANKTQTPSLVQSASPTQTGKDYDFSSLTQGFFSKP